MTAARLLLVAALLGPAPVPAALGQESGPAPARTLPEDERRRELEQLRRRLSTLRSRYEATKKKETDLAEELATAELALQIKTDERRQLELEYADVERAAAQALVARDQAAGEADGLRRHLSVRVAALYRMGRLGYLRTLVVAETGRTFLRGLQVLAHMAQRDADLLARYETSLTLLEAREHDLADRRQELGRLADESRQKEAELAEARQRKATLLSRVRRTSETQRAEVEDLERRSQRLAALLDLLETHGRSLAPGAASIRSYRGALDWPLKGRVLVPFGRVANPAFPKTFLRSTGWTLEAEPGAEAQAVFAGEVVYAQWLKGYGNLVVLDHGDGVFTLYGRLATGTAARGTRVGIGEAVGRLAPPGDEEVPGLYFEIRESRASVDPRLWLR